MVCILHTSDWHLGQTLYDRPRDDDEFAPFLSWLLKTLTEESVDVLLVAGDIFDTAHPSPRAQTLYYDFLRQASSRVRQVVVTAGNHDSPSFLDAASGLLQLLNVFVVGTANIDTEVLDFGDVIVAAVPFLRERDVRRNDGAETPEETSQRIVEGTRQHYAELVARCVERRGGRDIPLVAMGHLFVSGGTVSDGVRELYVGNLGQLRGDTFPPEIDYLALGHLHIPQRVGKSETRRYSGSPLAMSFDEARQAKQVVKITFDARTPTITTIPVPKWVELVSLKGDAVSLHEQIESLGRQCIENAGNKLQQPVPVICELELTGSEASMPLRATLEEHFTKVAPNCTLKVVRVRRASEVAPASMAAGEDVRETLRQLDPTDVFTRCLDAHSVADESRATLLAAHAELLNGL